MSDPKEEARAIGWRADVASPEAEAAASERERRFLVNWIRARLLVAHPSVVTRALLAEAGALGGTFAPMAPDDFAGSAFTVVLKACLEARGDLQSTDRPKPEVH